MQCTQCHNHPFNEWKQNQFWEMNAFFRQTKAKTDGPRKSPDRISLLVNEDFTGEPKAQSKTNPSKAIFYYELRNGMLKSAYPVFVDGTEIDRQRLSEQSRSPRASLAKLIVESPYLDKAIANRMWGHFLGYGFTKPIDDMGPHNPPSHPELLEELATSSADQQLRPEEADAVDRAERAVWAVEQDDSKGRNDKDDPSLGEKPMFSHFYLRQMQAEELYESLLVATEAHESRRQLRRARKAQDANG